MNIQELNISDYLEQDKLIQLSDTQSFDGEVDTTINDILVNGIKEKSDILLYLPDGFITLTLDKILIDKKVQSLTIDGSGMYTTKLKLILTPEFPLKKIKLLNLQLTDVSIVDSPLLKNIKLTDVEVLKASIKDINLIMVNCEFNEVAEFTFDGGMGSLSNVIFNGAKKIEFKNSNNITVMNISAESSIDIKVIDATVNDILSTNIKYITEGSSNILSMKNARLYSYKECIAGETLALLSIMYNAVIHLPKGVRITDINLDTIYTPSEGGGSTTTYKQESYEWFIEADKIYETDTYITMKYNCHKVANVENPTTTIIKIINK